MEESKMKGLRLLSYLMLVGIASLVACGKSSKTTAPKPTPTPPPACETNHTATVTFENKSTTNTTYDVVLDGIHVATIGPGEVTSAFTVTAVVQHTITFKITNSNNIACSTATVSFVQCSTQLYYCTH